MPAASSNNEEETYDLQTGAGRPANSGRRGRKQRGHRGGEEHPPPPGGDDGSSSGSGSDGSGEEDDEEWEEVEEEDLCPDVRVPEPDDIVRIRDDFRQRAFPLVPHAPDWADGHPLFTMGVRLGVVLEDGDARLEGVQLDLSREAPVCFLCVDDRADAVPYRRVEIVPMEALEIVCRPFTASEFVVANGDVGVVDELETSLYIKSVPFPAWVAAMAGNADIAVAELDAPVGLDELVDARKRSAAAAEAVAEAGGEGYAEEEHDSDGADSAVEHAKTAKRGAKGRKRRFARGRKTAGARPADASRNKAPAVDPEVLRKHQRAPYPLGFKAYLDSCERVPVSQFLPLHPFRPEVAVVHRHSHLIGMVTRVHDHVIVALDGGLGVVLCTDLQAANSATISDLPSPTSDNWCAPSQRVKFRMPEALPYLHVIAKGGALPEPRDGLVLTGCIISVVPGVVRCAFTTDAGLNWDAGTFDCEPEDLVPVDYYYPEFTNLLTPGYHLTSDVRDAIHDEMERRVRERGAERGDDEATVDAMLDALRTQRQEREDALRQRQAARETEPHGLVDSVDDGPAATLAPAPELDEELRRNAEANGDKRWPPATADIYDENDQARGDLKPPAATAESLSAVLRHTSRNSADDVPSLCGCLTPVEFVTFYQLIAPPKTLPPAYGDARDPHSLPAEEQAQRTETIGRWLSLLQQLNRFLPALVSVRSTAVNVTIAWNSGRVDYNIDGREVVLRLEPATTDVGPPPEVTRLVAPGSARASSFPMSMLSQRTALTERVSEYDLGHLPDVHYAATPGDIVYRRCRDDFDRDAAGEPMPDPLRVVGRVLESNEAERVCVVHWVPTDLDVDVTQRDSFPERADPDVNQPLVRAATRVDPIFGDLQIGGVIRVLSEAVAVVLWWDGTLELVPSPLLTVVRFDELEEEGGEAVAEEAAAEDESAEETAASEAPDAAAGGEDGAEATAGPDDGSAAEKPAGVRAWLEKATEVVRRVVGRATAEHDATGHEEPDAAAATDATSEPPAAAAEDDGDGAAAAAAAPAAAAAESPTDHDLPRFTCVPTFASHLLQDEANEGGPFSPAEPMKFYRRVQGEWRMLQREVPAGVSVKVSEESMHLMKLLIRGPVHTPYYQAVYAFDLLFPADFPSKPPRVKFHSYNLRLNPNLYETGYVCLSLLGTWRGQESCEEWSPQTSNVLQVVHGLQAMVLNKEPYFNEPGFEEARGTERGRAASRLANESYYLLKMEHMLHMVAAPPADWVFEVRRHAREFMPRIIARAERYSGDAPAGEGAPAPAEGAINADGLVLPLSRGFHLALKRRLGHMREKFEAHTRQWDAEDKAFRAAVGDDGTEEEEGGDNAGAAA